MVKKQMDKYGTFPMEKKSELKGRTKNSDSEAKSHG